MNFLTHCHLPPKLSMKLSTNVHFYGKNNQLSSLTSSVIKGTLRTIGLERLAASPLPHLYLRNPRSIAAVLHPLPPTLSQRWKQVPTTALQATSGTPNGFKKKIFNGIGAQIIRYNKNIQNIHNTKIFRNQHCGLCFLLFFSPPPLLQVLGGAVRFGCCF